MSTERQHPGDVVRPARRGRPALAVVLGASGPWSTSTSPELDVEIHLVDDASVHLVRVARTDVPAGAEHLLAAGTVLPAAVDPADARTVIDWSAAADGLVSRRTPAPGAILAALATGGLGATSADAPGLRRPVLPPADV